MVMGMRMTSHRNTDFIILSVDISNAYIEVTMSSVVERRMESDTFSGMVRYRRAKLGPNSKLWTRRAWNIGKGWCKDLRRHRRVSHTLFTTRSKHRK